MAGFKVDSGQIQGRFRAGFRADSGGRGPLKHDQGMCWSLGWGWGSLLSANDMQHTQAVMI